MDSRFFSEVGENAASGDQQLLSQLEALVRSTPDLVRSLLAKATE